MKTFLKLFAYTIAVLVLLLVVFMAINFTYLQRVYTGFKTDTVTDVSWFDPTVAMTPSESGEKFVQSVAAKNSQQIIFSDAITYAESIDSNVLLIWQDGELLAEKYWNGFDASSYYQSQSINKSLLALAVGVAVSEGAITSLNDSASKYIGDWIDQPFGEITIENLLTMTSGLDNPAFSPNPFSHSNKLLNSSDISSVARSLQQVTAPAETFHYMNAVPQLMVDVLEAATGEDYETYLQNKIWSKFAVSPGHLWMDREGGTPHGFCCLIATAQDLLRLGLLFLNNGSVNGQQIVDRDWMSKVMSPSAANPNYGYYTWLGTTHTPMRTYSPGASFGVVHSEPYLADDVIFFDGFGGQRVYVIPSQQLVIVRIGETRFDFDDAQLPNRVIEVLNLDEE